MRHFLGTNTSKGKGGQEDGAEEDDTHLEVRFGTCLPVRVSSMDLRGTVTRRRRPGKGTILDSLQLRQTLKEPIVRGCLLITFPAQHS